VNYSRESNEIILKKKEKRIVLLLLILGSCGKKETQTFEYTYQYNDCSTGTHAFDSQEALCAALFDDELNNYCAYGMREERAKADGCHQKF